MTFWRLRFPRAALLAWLAVLALAIVPTVSRAITPIDLAQYRSDLCRSGDDAVVHDGLSACGLCAVAAAPLLPAAVPAWWAPVAVAEPPAPVRATSLAATRPRAAQARGPPVFG